MHLPVENGFKRSRTALGGLGFRSALSTRSRAKKEVTRLHTQEPSSYDRAHKSSQQTHAMLFWSVSGNTDAVAIEIQTKVAVDI